MVFFLRNYIPLFNKQRGHMDKNLCFNSFNCELCIFLQNTWAGAMRVCRSIGMELLAVEYDDKDLCIAKLAGSKYSDIVIYLLFWALAKKRWYFLLVILNN